jgi:hypothetical protein
MHNHWVDGGCIVASCTADPHVGDS